MRTLLNSALPTKEYFLDYVEETSYCWYFHGSKNSDGYGIWKEGIQITAHRLSYLLFKGPIENKIIHHTCECKMCVNPDHLEATDSPQAHGKLHKQKRVQDGKQTPILISRPFNG